VIIGSAWCGLIQSRSGTLKKKKKLCSRRDIDEGLFRRQPSIDLIYERSTVFERGPSPDLLEHDCTSSSKAPGWPYPVVKGNRDFLDAYLA
jgi:hypothetical protein